MTTVIRAWGRIDAGHCGGRDVAPACGGASGGQGAALLAAGARVGLSVSMAMASVVLAFLPLAAGQVLPDNLPLRPGAGSLGFVALPPGLLASG